MADRARIAYPWWVTTRRRRAALAAELAAEPDVFRRGQLMDMKANEYQRIKVRVLFVPQDCWVGVYWKHTIEGWDGGWWEDWAVYLVLVPMLPVRLTVDRSNRGTRAYRRWRREVARG